MTPSTDYREVPPPQLPGRRRLPDVTYSLLSVAIVLVAVKEALEDPARLLIEV